MITLYDSAFPLVVRTLRNLSAIFEKAQAWAKAENRSETELMHSGLAPDMYPLYKQVHQLSNAVKGCAARLAGVEVPEFELSDDTFAGAKARVDKTLAFLESLSPDQISGDDDMRVVELVLPHRTLRFHARDYALGMMMPNFLFHTTTAYGILRNAGMPLGKADFIAGLPLIDDQL